MQADIVLTAILMGAFVVPAFTASNTHEPVEDTVVKVPLTEGL
ncbi:hypothetical protein CCP3SC1AL1_590001 [Gammaproteobacteria bacterium]